MRKLLLLGSVPAVLGWWFLAAPPDYHPVPDQVLFDDAAVRSAAAVDHSRSFAQSLEPIAPGLPGHDDIIFLDDGATLLLSGIDGQIWAYDRASDAAAPFVDPPLIAAGMHESITDHDHVYFCASRLWGASHPRDERVGLYRLSLSSKAIEPVVLYVPDTEITGLTIWGLDDAEAPALQGQASASSNSRARELAFCNDLELSADGKRIYFSEPFAYQGASMGGGTVPEAISVHGNGRVWMHDITSGATRLIAEGLFFPDGILYDIHSGGSREESILVSLTPGFSIVRLYVDGPRAGTHDTVQHGLGGMCDGMDRDSTGNIWCGMYARRTAFLTWLHANPWIKHLLLRLPLNALPQPSATGVLVLNPGAAEMLYSAWYEGEMAEHIASAIPGPDGYVYLTPFSREHRGLLRMPNPLAGPVKPASE